MNELAFDAFCLAQLISVPLDITYRNPLGNEVKIRCVISGFCRDEETERQQIVVVMDDSSSSGEIRNIDISSLIIVTRVLLQSF